MLKSLDLSHDTVSLGATELAEGEARSGSDESGVVGYALSVLRQAFILYALVNSISC